MCLFLKKFSFPRIALRPIKCYKIVVFDREDNSYKTPYQLAPISSEIINGEKAFEPKEDIKIYRAFGGYKYINEGIIHAYSDYHIAELEVHSAYLGASYLTPKEFDIKIFECEIPMFTKFYKDDIKDIGAMKIKFVKEKKKIDYLTLVEEYENLYGLNTII